MKMRSPWLWSASHKRGCLSCIIWDTTEIQDILENPSVGQLFVVSQEHKQVFPVFLCEILSYHVRRWAIGLRPDMRHVMIEHQVMAILLKQIAFPPGNRCLCSWEEFRIGAAVHGKADRSCLRRCQLDYAVLKVSHEQLADQGCAVPDELEQVDERLPVRVQTRFQALQQQLDALVPLRAPVGGQGARDPSRRWHKGRVGQNQVVCVRGDECRDIALNGAVLTGEKVVEGRVLHLKGHGTGIDIQQVDMAGTQFQRHKTQCAGASEWLEDDFAVHDVREMQHVVHQVLLGSAQMEDPEPVRLPEDLRLDEQAVAEAIQHLVALDLMGAMEEVGQGTLHRPVAALCVIKHASAPQRTRFKTHVTIKPEQSNGDVICLTRQPVNKAFQ